MANRSKFLVGTLALTSTACAPVAYVDKGKERIVREEAREVTRKFIGDPDKEMRAFSWDSGKEAPAKSPKAERTKAAKEEGK